MRMETAPRRTPSLVGVSAATSTTSMVTSMTICPRGGSVCRNLNTSNLHSSNLKLVLGVTVSGHKTCQNPHFEYMCEVTSYALMVL